MLRERAEKVWQGVASVAVEQLLAPPLVPNPCSSALVCQLERCLTAVADQRAQQRHACCCTPRHDLQQNDRGQEKYAVRISS